MPFTVMVNIDSFRKLALSFADVVELPHFEKTSFRIKKKIFTTLAVEEMKACLKLSLIEQSVFCAFDKTIIYPVPNKWGQQGWTMVDLKKIKTSMLKDVLEMAYKEVSNAKPK